jgi:hypothetical protein
MKIQKLISAGFATAALASASVPALAWTVWPDVDFQWYADVGKPTSGTTVEITPAPRSGYIWTPGHWENRGAHQAWVSGHFVKDDYERQVLVYNNGNGTTTYATGPTVLYDSQGNMIPTSPDAYPIGSSRR